MSRLLLFIRSLIAQRVQTHFGRLVLMSIITFIFVMVAALSPEVLLWLDKAGEGASRVWLIVIGLSVLLISFFPLLWVAPMISMAFLAHPSRPARLTLVIFAYVNTILMFACFYFMASVVSDYNRAVVQKYDIKYAPPETWRGKEAYEFRKAVLGIQSKDSPFLRGLTSHVLVGLIDDLLDPTVIVQTTETGASRIVDDVWHRHPKMDEFMKLLGEDKLPFVRVEDLERIPLYVECLHFSVVTAATVGYGEIHPGSTLARLVVDFQIIASTAILVIGLGLALSGPTVKESQEK